MLFMVIERFKDRDPIPMTFEIVPVVPSKETREVVGPFLDRK